MPTNLGNYDAPSFTVRQLNTARSTVGAGTATPGAIFVPGIACDVWNGHYRITAAGTGAGACLRMVTISGTTTTTIGTATLGTAAVSTMGNLLSTATKITPANIAAGGRVYAETIADATLAAEITWEYNLDPDTAVGS